MSELRREPARAVGARGDAPERARSHHGARARPRDSRAPAARPPRRPPSPADGARRDRPRARLAAGACSSTAGRRRRRLTSSPGFIAALVCVLVCLPARGLGRVNDSSRGRSPACLGCIGLAKEKGLNKVFPSAIDAVRDIPSGAALLAGGFGLCGIPENCIRRAEASYGTERPHRRVEQLRRRRLRPRHLAAQQADREDGLQLRRREQGVRAPVPSRGELEVELTPQGTLAERLRAGGAGIPAFFTPTGAGTQISEGGLPLRYAPDGSVAKISPKKETREFDGRPHVLEPAIRGDFRHRQGMEEAIGAATSVYRHTAMKLQPDDGPRRAAASDRGGRRARRGHGSLDPDTRSTLPGIFVRIFKEDLASRSASSAVRLRGVPEVRHERAATWPQTRPHQLAAPPRRGYATADYVTHLGIGMPTLIANLNPVRASRSCSRARTGCTGIGPYFRAEDADRSDDDRRLSKETVTMLPEAPSSRAPESFGDDPKADTSTWPSSGRCRWAKQGDLANWMIPGKSGQRVWEAPWIWSPAPSFRCHHGALGWGGNAQDSAPMLLAAHGPWRSPPDRDRAGGHRRHPGRTRPARSGPRDQRARNPGEDRAHPEGLAGSFDDERLGERSTLDCP